MYVHHLACLPVSGVRKVAPGCNSGVVGAVHASTAARKVLIVIGTGFLSFLSQGSLTIPKTLLFNSCQDHLKNWPPGSHIKYPRNHNATKDLLAHKRAGECAGLLCSCTSHRRSVRTSLHDLGRCEQKMHLEYIAVICIVLLLPRPL